MCGQRLSDDEVVYRRIPRATHWFEEPDKITSANFKLDQRIQETGVSVYRGSVVNATEVLSKPDAIPGSLVAVATVGEIRRLENAAGAMLGLDVVIVDDANDPGHSEIRGPVEGKMSPSASNALKKLFKLP